MKIKEILKGLFWAAASIAVFVMMFSWGMMIAVNDYIENGRWRELIILILIVGVPILLIKLLIKFLKKVIK